MHSGRKKPQHITAPQTCKIFKKRENKKVKHPYLRFLVCMPTKDSEGATKKL